MGFDLETLEQRLKMVLPQGLVVRFADLRESFDPTTGAQAFNAAIHLAGRDCAKRALSELGLDNEISDTDENGAAVWPRGFQGSISHKGPVALAVVASSPPFLGIGVDLEVVSSTDSELLISVASPKEIAAFKAFNIGDQILGAILFSTKEAVFKCVYPLIRSRDLRFDEVQISPVSETLFRAQFDGTRFDALREVSVDLFWVSLSRTTVAIAVRY